MLLTGQWNLVAVMGDRQVDAISGLSDGTALLFEETGGNSTSSATDYTWYRATESGVTTDSSGRYGAYPAPAFYRYISDMSGGTGQSGWFIVYKPEDDLDARCGLGMSGYEFILPPGSSSYFNSGSKFNAVLQGAKGRITLWYSAKSPTGELFSSCVRVRSKARGGAVQTLGGIPEPTTSPVNHSIFENYDTASDRTVVGAGNNLYVYEHEATTPTRVIPMPVNVDDAVGCFDSNNKLHVVATGLKTTYLVDTDTGVVKTFASDFYVPPTQFQPGLNGKIYAPTIINYSEQYVFDGEHWRGWYPQKPSSNYTGNGKIALREPSDEFYLTVGQKSGGSVKELWYHSAKPVQRPIDQRFPDDVGPSRWIKLATPPSRFAYIVTGPDSALYGLTRYSPYTVYRLAPGASSWSSAFTQQELAYGTGLANLDKNLKSDGSYIGFGVYPTTAYVFDRAFLWLDTKKYVWGSIQLPWTSQAAAIDANIYIDSKSNLAYISEKGANGKLFVVDLTNSALIHYSVSSSVGKSTSYAFPHPNDPNIILLIRSTIIEAYRLGGKTDGSILTPERSYSTPVRYAFNQPTWVVLPDGSLYFISASVDETGDSFNLNLDSGEVSPAPSAGVLSPNINGYWDAFSDGRILVPASTKYSNNIPTAKFEGDAWLNWVETPMPSSSVTSAGLSTQDQDSGNIYVTSRGSLSTTPELWVYGHWPPKKKPAPPPAGHAKVRITASGAGATIPAGTGHAVIRISADATPVHRVETVQDAVIELTAEGAGKFIRVGSPGGDEPGAIRIYAKGTAPNVTIGEGLAPIRILTPRAPARVTPLGHGAAEIILGGEGTGLLRMVGKGQADIVLGGFGSWGNVGAGDAVIEISAEGRPGEATAGRGRALVRIGSMVGRAYVVHAGQADDLDIVLDSAGAAEGYHPAFGQDARVVISSVGAAKLDLSGQADALLRITARGWARVFNEAWGDAEVHIWGWGDPIILIDPTDALLSVDAAARGFVLPAAPREVVMNLDSPTAAVRLDVEITTVGEVTQSYVEVV